MLKHTMVTYAGHPWCGFEWTGGTNLEFQMGPNPEF